MSMETRNIFFSELTTEVQNKILDSFGASSAAELGLDKKPYITATYDSDGHVEAVGVFEPAF